MAAVSFYTFLEPKSKAYAVSFWPLTSVSWWNDIALQPHFHNTSIASNNSYVGRLKGSYREPLLNGEANGRAHFA